MMPVCTKVSVFGLLRLAKTLEAKTADKPNRFRLFILLMHNQQINHSNLQLKINN